MAQNTLEIIIKANSSKAITEIKKLDTTIGKMSGTSAKGFDALKAKWTALDNKLSSPGGFKVMLGAAGAAVGVLTTVGVTVKKLADDFMDYAFQVEDFGRIIGATPEEASKLIQVADDVRLSVESMTTAMRSAITKGYAPTVQELGKMSDAYLAIQDPIARSKFLVDTFGRSGLEMAKLMELGSDKIMEMGDSIEGTARLMTADGIKAAKAYYDALDNLGDAADNATLALGMRFAPVIANVADELVNVADDSVNLIDMFSAMQTATEVGAASFSDIVLELAAYMAATKSGADITAELTKKIQDVTYNTDNFGNVLPDVNERLKASEAAAKGAAAAVGDVGDKADKSASDLARMAGKLEGIPESVQVQMDFQLPDITSKLSDWVRNKKWEEAGGEVVNKFLSGITAAMQGLDSTELGAVSSKLAALELAIKVKIGEIDPREAAQALQDAFPELKGGAPMAEIQAAIAIDVNASDTAIQDYLKSALTEPVEYSVTPTIPEASKAELKAAIEAVTDATFPVTPIVKTEGMRANLMSQITAAAGGEIPLDLVPKIKEMSTAELAALTSKLTPQPFDMKITPKIEQSDLDTLFKAIDATVPRDAATEWGEMQQKIEGTTTAIRLGQSDLSGWNSTTGSLAESSQAAAKQVGALNTQLKNMPKVIDVAINIKTSGGGTTPAKTRRRAEGGPVYSNNAYLVGERGPELFVPNMSGRIIPNNQVTNNNTDKNIYITNNYTINAIKDINIRELARQVTREQQRTGAT